MQLIAITHRLNPIIPDLIIGEEIITLKGSMISTIGTQPNTGIIVRHQARATTIIGTGIMDLLASRYGIPEEVFVAAVVVEAEIKDTFGAEIKDTLEAEIKDTVEAEIKDTVEAVIEDIKRKQLRKLRT